MDNTLRIALRIVAALVMAALCAACATQPVAWSDRGDAAPRLAAVLDQWLAMRAAGGVCEDGSAPGRPGHDCARIQLELRRLAVEFPENPAVLFASAVVSYEAGHADRAQAYLDSLRRVRPIHPEAAMLRARIAIGEGNLPFARRLLREAMEFSPDHHGLREALASAEFLAGDYEAARRELRAAERLGAPAWRIAYHRGLVEEALGGAEAAATQYRLALQEKPDFDRAWRRYAGLAAVEPE